MLANEQYHYETNIWRIHNSQIQYHYQT